MPGAKVLRWDDEARETIMAAARKLQSEGMSRPFIRAVLYVLADTVPGWTKGAYNRLCRKLGEWRDAGKVPYGLFSDDGGGSRSRPYTPREIAEQIQRWKDSVPVTLPPDGKLRALLLEHEALVGQVQEWCDGRALLVSSGGQLRRENLWSAIEGWRRVSTELGAKGILAYSLVDWDKGGRDIHGAHARWFARIAHLELKPWGLSREQLKHVGLSPQETAQIDGAFGLAPGWWKQQIRGLLRVE